jgi:hypothetical protein
MSWLDEVVGVCDVCGAELTRTTPRAIDPPRKVKGVEQPRTLGCLRCKLPDYDLGDRDPPSFTLKDGKIWNGPGRITDQRGLI